MTLRAAPDWLTRWEYAHRGLHSEGVPENSLAAARAAIAAGMGIECDIQRSADGVPMVFHDWELERLTNGTGQTGDHNAAELAALTLHGSDQSPYPLAQLLEEVGGRVPILIEIKSKPAYDVERSCLAVRDALATYGGRVAVMSFDPHVAQWFRQHAPATAAGLVMREDEYGYTQSQAQRDEAFAIACPDFLAYHVLALPNENVAKMRADGLSVLTWTVNSPETRMRAKVCADALISEGKGLG